MSKNRSRPDPSPAVLLKSGGQTPAVFLVPGIGGSSADFDSLAKRIRGSHTIYALQPRGMHGVDSPCDRVEEMAEYYLQIVRRSQPQGPYILVGYSLGGLVTLEMARTLIARKQEVALLVMIDSYLHFKFLSPGQQLRLLARRIKQRIRKFRRALGTTKSEDPTSPNAIASFAPWFDRARSSAYTALRNYKPVFYTGQVKFIRAENVSDFPADPHAVWSHFLELFSVETVPGNHLTMLNTHFADLADVLNRYLEAI